MSFDHDQTADITGSAIRASHSIDSMVDRLINLEIQVERIALALERLLEDL